MPKIQLLTGKIHINNGLNVVVRDQFNPLTATEVSVLQEAHQNPAVVTDLAAIGWVERDKDAEISRLIHAGYDGNAIKTACPGVGLMQTILTEIPGVPEGEVKPVPEPDIATQKTMLANKILEMGGTPPPHNMPLQKFNKVLADLMEEAGVSEDESAEREDAAMLERVEERAIERAEKRILASQIRSRGGAVPDMGAPIEAFEEALDGAGKAPAPADALEEPFELPADATAADLAARTDEEVAEGEEAEDAERERLIARIKELKGRVPHGNSSIEKFREVAAALEAREAG